MNLEKLITLRKDLHRYPELSGEEFRTALQIFDFLKETKPDEIMTEVAETGIMAVWDSGKKGPSILIRGDMDALPITETNQFSHASHNKGVSHACGHDGHSTILCGIAQTLAHKKPKAGKVILLFQPSEENGEGAKAVIQDSRFKAIKPDYVFALHNLPGYPLNAVIVKEGNFTAAVNSIIIHLKGKTSHAAEPEHGLNPALAVANIIKESLKLSINDEKRDDMQIITPIYMSLGEKAYGTSAGEASVHLTLRCWHNENLRKLETDIQSLARTIAKEEKLKIEFEFIQTFFANENDTQSTNFVREAAKKTGRSIVERDFPFKWGEDFGVFTSTYKGCMFGIGAGIECPALHNPDYDFPDELIETGVQLFIQIIQKIQQEHV